MLIYDIVPPEKIKKVAKEILGIKEYKTKREKFLNIGARIGVLLFFVSFLVFQFTPLKFSLSFPLGEKRIKKEVFYPTLIKIEGEGWEIAEKSKEREESSERGVFQKKLAFYQGGLGTLKIEGFKREGEIGNLEEIGEIENKENEVLEEKNDWLTDENATSNEDKNENIIEENEVTTSTTSTELKENEILEEGQIGNTTTPEVTVESQDTTTETQETATESEIETTTESEIEKGEEKISFFQKIKDLFKNSVFASKGIFSAKIRFSFLAEKEDLKDLTVWWSFDGENWEILGNGDFEFEMPFLKSFEDVENLKIKIEGVAEEKREKEIVLDGVLIEVEFEEIENFEEEFVLVPQKKVFKANENPEFILQKREKGKGIFGEFFEAKPKLKKLSLKISPEKEIELEEGRDFESYQNSPLKIVLEKRENLKPGVNVLRAEIEVKERELVVESYFVWGVLAINTSKSIYLPGETAYIQMAALREDGHTLCDANLKLEIETPKGEIFEPEIQRSGECGPNNVTQKPDYFAFFQVNDLGLYKMRLKNLDKDWEIEDSFEVRDSVPFDIERIGPTRIWPKAKYEMRLKIKANEDLKGEIVELVPADFEISNVQPPFAEIREKEREKEIIWKGDFKAGKIYELSYQFDAPDISPYLYLLGPLKIKRENEFFPFPFAIFSEVRAWQVVADALDESELEYMIDVGPIVGTATANYVYVSLFNPSGSGRVVLIKRVAIRAHAVAAANYVNLSLRRISAASGGTLINASDIPKKNASSSDPVLEIRHSGPTVTFLGVVQSRLMGQPMPGAAGHWYSIRDISFGPNDEKIVLQPGEGVALYQEAAGDTDQRIRMYVEWEEVTNTPLPQNEYLLAIQRVEVAASANYVYNSFFNPSGSGKTAIVKRIWFGAETCDAAAVYTNNISIRRISSASGGTQIAQANIPKKHTGSPDSVMDVRYAGVTVTLVGGTNARLGMITPCAVAGQPHGFMQINFHQNDEKLILQPGEGIALISEAAGDVDQLVRMIIEWKEVPASETPSPQGEYIWASSRIEYAAPIGTTFYSFYNPTGSGKTAIIKRLVIRNDADAAATYSAFKFRRLISASGGILISASDIPKKHTGSPDSAMQIRWCGSYCSTPITATYLGTTDSTLLQVNGPGAVGQVIGHREIVFGDNEKLILQEGEGIGFYIDVIAGDVDHYIKILIEWQETTSTPSPQNEYIIDPDPVNGSTAASYNYISFFNPSNSGKTAIIKRISVRIDTAGAAVYIPMKVRRITAVSGGTQITAENIPKKHSGSSNSAMDIRKAGMTVTFAQGANAQLIGVQTPGAVGALAAPSLTGYRELIFANDERIILQPGEGIVLHHDTAAGDTDFRVKMLIEWQEVDQDNTPNSQGEYLMTIGPINGSLNANYVYATIFNPSNSGKSYVVKRIGIRADRFGALTAPGYIPITLRKITSASGGTQISNSDIPKKHTGTGTSTAEIRIGGVTVTFAGTTVSRLLGVTAPGAVNQSYGDYEIEIVFGDELILFPGEGIALYQEQAAGDTNIRFRFDIEWSEISPVFIQSNWRFFENADSVQPGEPLAEENATATNALPFTVYRLRINLLVETTRFFAQTQTFKLQFATSSGDCSEISDWVDVGAINSETIWRGYDNPTPNDGAEISATLLSNSNVRETYEEENPSALNPNDILVGQRGEWDFVIENNNAPPETPYCFRMVKEDGTPLDGYDSYPVIITSPPVIKISGRVFVDEGQTISTDGCIVSLVSNGNFVASTTASTTTGIFLFSNIFSPSGTIFHVYLDNCNGKGVTVTRSAQSDISDLDIYQNRIIVRHEDLEAISVSDLDHFDSEQDPDILYTASSSAGTLQTAKNTEFFIWQGKTFDGWGEGIGNLSFSDVDIRGTFNATSSQEILVSCSGSFSGASCWQNLGSFNFASSTVIFTATSTGKIINAGESGFYNLEFNGPGGSFQFSTSTTIYGNLRMVQGTLIGDQDLTIKGGNLDCGLTCGEIDFSGGTTTIENSGNFGTSGLSFDWTFYNLVFGNGSDGGETQTFGFGTTTILNNLKIAQNHTLNAGSKTWVLKNSGTPFEILGNFISASSTFSFQGNATTTIPSAVYYNLEINPASSTAEFNFSGDSATTTNDFSIKSGQVFAPTSTLAVGGNWQNEGSFFHNYGKVIFNATDLGKIINSGGTTTGKSFYDLEFNGSGGWQIENDILTENDLKIISAGFFDASTTQVTIEVRGDFKNYVGGNSTEWGNSTLYLNKTGGGEMEINPKDVSESYGTLKVGQNVLVKMWNSTAQNFILEEGAGIYSRNHAGNNGLAFIQGNFEMTTSSEYWSFEKDFDGTPGANRQVTVQIASSSSFTLSGGYLEISGTSSYPTIITNAGSGTFSFNITGGTFFANYYQFRNLNADGLNISGSPQILSLDYGDFQLAVEGGSLITVSPSVIEMASGGKILNYLSFSTSSSATSGYNVRLTGIPSCSFFECYWRFLNHSGGLDGENYDLDPGDSSPGWIQWEDSQYYTPRSQNWRFYFDYDKETPQEASAPENSAPINILNNTILKLRMTINNISDFPGENIKMRLQYSTSSDFLEAFFVAEIGDCSQSDIFCYADGVDEDGDSVTTLLLSDSQIGATHNESGISTSTFYHPASTAAEWEFTIKANNVEDGVVYYFRAYDNTNNQAVLTNTGFSYPSLVAGNSQLSFSIEGLPAGTTTEGVVTTIDALPNGIYFSTLDFDTSQIGAHRLTISTNAPNGYQIFVFQDSNLESSNGNFIEPFPCPNESPCSWNYWRNLGKKSAYGYHTGDDILSGNSSRFAPDDTYCAFETTPKEIGFHPFPVLSSIFDFIFRIEVTKEQPAGEYFSTISYLVFPFF